MVICSRIEGGELFDRVVDPKFDLTERVAILFMRQIVDAMEFIHSQNILHLDMKVLFLDQVLYLVYKVLILYYAWT